MFRDRSYLRKNVSGLGAQFRSSRMLSRTTRFSSVGGLKQIGHILGPKGQDGLRVLPQPASPNPMLRKRKGRLEAREERVPQVSAVPSPRNCGKTTYIQCVRLRPA